MKWLILILFFATIPFAENMDIQGGAYNVFQSPSSYSYVACDTMVGNDSLFGCDLIFWEDYLTGYYNGYIRVRSLNGNVKVKLCFQESVHKDSAGYYNRLTCDSIVAADSGRIELDRYIHTPPFGQFLWDSWGASTDSTEVWFIFDPISKYGK